MTIVGCHNEVKIPFGVLQLSDGKLAKIVEKPVHDIIINTGVYVIEPHIISYIPEGRHMDMNELIETVIEKEKVSVYPIYKGWFDIGQWEEYKRPLKNCKAQKAYKKMKVLGIIPARGGSKGMPKKNIRPLLNKPLIAWTIEQALKSKYIDRVVVSTDDPAIARLAKKHGADVPFMRPDKLATDKAKSIDVVSHALLSLPEKYDYVVLLQPTSPLRTADDIDACVKLCMSKGGNSCVSVTESEKNPHWMYSLDRNGRMHRLIKTKKQLTAGRICPSHTL